jgi:hypothetical protein
VRALSSNITEISQIDQLIYQADRLTKKQHPDNAMLFQEQNDLLVVVEEANEK